MQLFNMALLAKQCWRILQNQNSLLSRVLKMKYYPRCDMLSAPEKSNVSFVWKSLYSAMRILRQGTTFDVFLSIYRYNMAPDGNFTVKSTYNFVEHCNLTDHQFTGPSPTHLTEFFWKYTRRMPIPRKLEIFIWKAYNNGLPVGSELLRRFGFQEVKCRTCNYKIESSVHLFKDRWWLKGLWNTIGTNPSHLNIQFSNFADWIFYLSKPYQKKIFV